MGMVLPLKMETGDMKEISKLSISREPRKIVLRMTL